MSDMKKLLESMSKFSVDEGAVVIKTNKPIGSRVADIGSGGQEHNVKTDQAYDDAKRKQPQGADFAAQRRKERLAKNGRMDEQDLQESLMMEYRMFVEQPVAGSPADNTASPVANINPPGQGTGAYGSQDDQDTAQSQTPAEKIKTAGLQKTNLATTLKTAMPQTDVNKIHKALNTPSDSPMSSTDEKNLAGIAKGMLAPAMNTPAAAATLKNAIATANRLAK